MPPSPAEEHVDKAAGFDGLEAFIDAERELRFGANYARWFFLFSVAEASLAALAAFLFAMATPRVLAARAKSMKLRRLVFSSALVTAAPLQFPIVLFSNALTSRYWIINILALEMVDKKAGGRSWRCVRSANSRYQVGRDRGPGRASGWDS